MRRRERAVPKKAGATPPMLLVLGRGGAPGAGCWQRQPSGGLLTCALGFELNALRSVSPAISLPSLSV
jgi:hypothetical protein